MTTFICTGSLFSGWESIHNNYLLADSSLHPVCVELSAFSAKIFQEQASGTDQLNWKPPCLDNHHSKEAKLLLSTVQCEPPLMWADTSSCLFLDFWQKVSEDVRFVLFYSSPEFELSKYIQKHSYDPSTVKSVVDAWIVRTRSMLTFFMKFRSTSLLIDVQSAMGNPGKLISTINDVLDTELNEPARKNYFPQNDSVLYEYFAATLLADNDNVSDLFDEVRSTATILEKDVPELRDIRSRTELLIPDFLKKIDIQKQLETDLTLASDKLTMMGLQLHQTQKELESYYLKERDTAVLNEKYLKFLNQDSLLKLARLARLSESSDQ